MRKHTVALIRLGALGDIIHGLPLIHAIKKYRPELRVVWIAERKWEKVFSIVDGIDELILFDKPSGILTKNGLVSLRNLRRFLKSKGIDTAIDMQGLLKSSLVARATGASQIIGFSPFFCREPLSALLTKTRVKPSKSAGHVVNKNLALLKPLGIECHEVLFPVSVPAHNERVDKFLKKVGQGSPRVIINVSAGWETKKWPISRFAEVADALVSKFEAKIIIVWGPGEEDMARDLAGSMEYDSFISPETNVLELAVLASKSDIVISSDTGPLHIAVAVGTPTVAIFGPTSPARNGPYGRIHRTLVHERSCGNCYKRKCDKIPSCMYDLSVEDVLGACNELFTCHHNNATKKTEK